MRIAIDGRKWNDFGIGRYIRGLVEGLLRQEGDEEYILIAPPGAVLPSSPRLELVVDATKKYSLGELFSIGSILRREGADLFHSPHYVVPVTRRPTVVTIHDLIHLRLPGLASAHKRTYARMMLQRAVSNSRAILTVTRAVSDDIVRHFPGAKGKVHVTPNGIDPAFFEAEPREHDSRFFLYVGNDKPHKNLAGVVEAFELFRRSHPDYALVIAGARPERFEDVEGVILAGFVSDDELMKLYRDARGLLLVSLDEGFGLPAAEAMAIGTPVICSRIAALAEVSAGAALLVDPLQPESIAAAMEKLVGEDAIARTLRERGRTRARDFTWDRCAGETLQVYRSV